MNNTSAHHYHIFVAYSHADSASAEKVVNQLRQQGLRVFIDSGGSNPPPAVWADEIPKAQRGSQMTLVLVSENTERSHYQREEIASGIDLLNRKPTAHGVVGVYIGQLPEVVPYGLRILRTFVWDTEADANAEDISTKVAECLQGADTTTGIASRNTVFGAERLPGQAFAAELLTQPIHLAREGRRIRLTVDRRNVREAVFTNKGKSRLCEKMLDRETLRWAEETDRTMHDMLRGKDRSPSYMLPLHKFPLRWASGGVFSVVEIRETEELFTPFFFRDIPPIGWHISLGASESEDELGNPWQYSLREFFEETLVLTTEPQRGNSRRKRFGPGIGGVWEQTIEEVEAFAREHIDLRNRCDGLGLVQDNEVIAWQVEPTTMDLRIIDPSGAYIDHEGMLLSVNPTELGIETVAVLKYQLSDHDYLLDGEMLRGEIPEDLNRSTLVRMPMALISHDYLKEVFAPPDSVLEFVNPALVDEAGKETLAGQPSVRPRRPPRPNEIKIFTWDACRRRDLVTAEPGAHDYPSAHERARHVNWKRNFEQFFFDADGNESRENPYPLFTPPSAKAVTYYFANRP